MGPGNFEMSFILTLALGAFIFVTGVMQVATKKLFGNYNKIAKYTEESISKYAFITGFQRMFVGLLVISTRLSVVYAPSNFALIIPQLVLIFVMIGVLIITKVKVLKLK